jgi:dienelactone hydrolase
MSFLWYWPAGGWDFDQWKNAQTWKPVQSDQSGKAELISLADWKNQAAHWKEISGQILGELSDRSPKQMRWDFLGDELERQGSPSYGMQRVRYSLTDDEWGYAWLLQPRMNGRPRGAVIALHQTHPHGKSEAVGFEIDPDKFKGMNYAAEMAMAGFVVLAHDAIAFGERQSGHPNTKYHSAAEFFAAHPNGSVMGKMAFDTSRACDLLNALPQTKSLRIGCLGHSHGAYGTLFAMISDDRIQAGVISCGSNLLRKDPSPDRWWRKTALMPRLGFYESNINSTPIDFHIWLALLAPRPVLLTAGTQDAIFPNCAEMKPALKIVGDVYRQLGAERNFQTHVFDGGHSFPNEMRQSAYQLLDEGLK